MNHIFAFELIGLLLGLLCFPPWLVARWYAVRGDRHAIKRLLVIVPVLVAIGIGLTAAIIAMELKQTRSLLMITFAVLGIVGIMMSTTTHLIDVGTQ